MIKYLDNKYYLWSSGSLWLGPPLHWLQKLFLDNNQGRRVLGTFGKEIPISPLSITYKFFVFAISRVLISKVGTSIEKLLSLLLLLTGLVKLPLWVILICWSCWPPLTSCTTGNLPFPFHFPFPFLWCGSLVVLGVTAMEWLALTKPRILFLGNCLPKNYLLF